MGALSARPFWRDPVCVGAMALYALNRWLAKPLVAWPFLHFHFNDCLLIPAALPPVLALQELLGVRIRRGAPTGGEVFFHLGLWSFLFEVLGPGLFPVTGDWKDAACYAAGAIAASLCWFFQRRKGFDRLAGIYGILEGLFAGTALQAARRCHLERLSGCREVLIAGEGTGRCLEEALASCPHARFTCIDASSGMLERLALRVESRPDSANRVRLIRVRLPELPDDPIRYDAMITPFFLDCFEGKDLEALVETLAGRLRPKSLWLAADFHVPARGWRRWRARFWLWMLYLCFRAAAGIQARRLQDPSPLLETHGFSLTADRSFSNGFIRCRCWKRDQRSG